MPRQLQIHGLTGDVPYFGGRFTPAQAYAAARPRPVPSGASGDPGPIQGIPSSVPQAAPLRVPSNLQPTQAPSVLAAATAQQVSAPPGQVPGAALGTQAPATGAPMPPPPPATGGPARPESQRAIQQLLLAGVLTASEADQLATRLA